jgi:RNA polymerase sigma-70 factor (ECF subfamily)
MNPTDRNDEFLQLVSQHQVALYGYIFALVQDANDADDVMQRTLLTLWRRFDDFEPGTHFIRWAQKTAKFEVLNFARAQRRSRLVFSEEIIASLADQAEASLDPSTDDLQREALGDCISRLNGKDRELIQLCYEGDQKVKVVAKMLGRTSQSICNSLKRIRTALYNCIEQKLTPPEERA